MENKAHTIPKGHKVLFDVEQSAEQMRELLPAFIEYQQLQAEMKFIKFNACLKAGFTTEQALYLCKEDTIT